MRYSRWQSSYSGFGFSPGMTSTVKVLIIINVIFFLLMHIFPRLGWFSLFGLVPRYVFSKLMLWQLVTYMFVHAGLFHLLINMLMLWFFAPAIERAWGRKRFLTYYFFTGIAAGLCSFITSVNSPIPVVGASGAIFGILVAYAVLFPETTVLFLFIFPMKIKYAIFILGAINLLGAITEPGSGIAYFAHLGGGLFGYLYLKNRWLRGSLQNITSFWQKRKSKTADSRREDFEKDVNRILDKVSREGLDSLTPRERNILQEKSRQD